MFPEWQSLNLPSEAVGVLSRAPSVRVARGVEELAAAAVGDGVAEVAYEVPGRGRVVEAVAVAVRNGISANYLEPYMRRRDADALVVGDEEPTDKTRYRDRFGGEFAPVREATFEWLAGQELVVFPFLAGERSTGVPAAVVAPANAGFFALGLALLQGILDVDELPEGFVPRAVIYVAPPFRHTHFDGRQVVVHNRREADDLHELFSYNLYPGPSAKKGVYGVLINIGEHEGWVVAHCSTVQVVTPYDNVVTLHARGSERVGEERDARVPPPRRRRHDGARQQRAARRRAHDRAAHARLPAAAGHRRHGDVPPAAADRRRQAPPARRGERLVRARQPHHPLRHRPEPGGADGRASASRCCSSTSTPHPTAAP